MPLVKVTRHSQVTIPRSVRERTGISEGDRVRIEARDGHIVLQKAGGEVWEDPTGFLPENFEEVVKGLRKNSGRRLRRLGISP